MVNAFTQQSSKLFTLIHIKYNYELKFAQLSQGDRVNGELDGMGSHYWAMLVKLPKLRRGKG